MPFLILIFHFFRWSPLRHFHYAIFSMPLSQFSFFIEIIFFADGISSLTFSLFSAPPAISPRFRYFAITSMPPLLTLRIVFILISHSDLMLIDIFIICHYFRHILIFRDDIAMLRFSFRVYWFWAFTMPLFFRCFHIEDCIIIIIDIIIFIIDISFHYALDYFSPLLSLSLYSLY